MDCAPVQTVWHMPPGVLTLGPREVHVWRVDLDRHQARQPMLWETLSPDERLRAQRFRFQEHETRFVVGRGLLRTLLGRYLRASPERLQFRYTSHGKPELAPCTGGNLSFNLSHTGGVALVAVTLDRHIGVDVERVPPQGWDYQEIASRFFSPGEVARINALPSHARLYGFFTCWTLKEAYLKAVGVGLSMPLNQFEVVFGHGEQATLSPASGAAEDLPLWSLRRLDPGAGLVGAVCAEGQDWHSRFWQWTDW